MIHDLKVSFQLLKFGFQVKMQIVFMLIFLFIGLAMEVMGDGTYWLGAWFILLVPMYFVQLWYGLLLSNMVMSSPYNKKFQTTISAIVTLVFSTIGMTALVIIKYWKIQNYPELRDSIMITLLFTGVAAVVINVYTVVTYKYYALAIFVIMLAVVLISFMTGMGRHMPVPSLHQMSFGAVVALSYGMVILSALLQYGVSCLLYRKPLSEYAQGAMMRKYLKG